MLCEQGARFCPGCGGGPDRGSHLKRTATLGGFTAISLWATTIAVTGALAQNLSVWSASSTTQGIAGLLGLLLGGRAARGWYRLPGRYLLGCGALFVLYMVLLSAAIGAAKGAQDLVAVSLLNYLWPALTVALSVPLFGYKARAWLWPSLLLGSAGAWLAILGDDPASVLASPNPLSWLCAAGGALAWAAYSNLTRRLGGDHKENAVPVFMLASAAALALGGLGAGDDLGALSQTNGAQWAALLYMAALPGWLAYNLWDQAMRNGNPILVAAASYATPIGSTLAISALHGLTFSWYLVAAVLLVLAGGVGSRLSVRDQVISDR